MIRRSHTECKFYHIWVTGINEEKKKKNLGHYDAKC